MSKGLTGLAMIACASAPLGGLLSDLFSWRAALLAPAVFGLLCLGLVALRFQETVPRKNPVALQPAVLLQTWATILRNPTFLAFSTLAAASYSGLFTFLASSSFVLIGVLGLSKTQYSMVMLSSCVVYMTGTILCRRLVPWLGLRKTVALAAAFTLAGGTLMGVLALLGVRSVWAIVLPFFLFMLAHGIHQPCSQSGAIGPFPQAAGAASALNGFIMMAAAFGMGTWLGGHMDGSVFPLVYGMWFWSVVLSVSAWTLVQKYGNPAPVITPAVAPAP